MKRLFAMMLAAAMCLSLCVPEFAFATERDYTENGAINAQTRDIIDLQHTEIAYYSSNSAYLTLTYTVVDDSANASGYRIVGIGRCTVEKRSGWTDVGTATVLYDTGITYYNNRQIAVVPVSYQASTGSGFANYGATVTINLNA